MNESCKDTKHNEGTTMELTETNRICNRHKARILQNLEDAQCPVVFRDAVAAGLNWLRSDLNDNARNEGANNDKESQGNC